MVTKSIYSRAPTRIDLAGGTVDIWPLYLFLDQPLTLNLGIDLFAEATLSFSEASSDGPQVCLKSEDQNHEFRFPLSEIQSPLLKPHPSLILHTLLLRYFYEKRIQHKLPMVVDLTLCTRARSPAGAGLGGSSTLSIAMIGALGTWAQHDLNSSSKSSVSSVIDPEKNGEIFIEIVRDIETRVIQVPAGLQDYYGAMYGGLQCLRWGIGSHHREALPEALISELEKRVLLFYSGQSRNSGINNWALFKGFIDRQDQIQSKFQEISKATHELEKSLRNRDWAGVGKAIQSEWEVRRTLAPGITTPEINAAFSEAMKIAPVAGKVCGAGGGGCFFVYLADESHEAVLKAAPKIREAFLKQGMKELPFRGSPHGLEVKINCA